MYTTSVSYIAKTFLSLSSNLQEEYQNEGAIRTLSQSFQYTEGLKDYLHFERNGCVLGDDSGVNCDGCDFHINGEMCSSCSLITCDAGDDSPYQALRVDCTNIHQGATMDLCNEAPDHDIFKVFAGHGFDQCEASRPWTPKEICEYELPFAEQSGFQCNCVSNDNRHVPVTTLDCTLGCFLCDPEKNVCGRMEYVELYENANDFTTVTQTFEYKKGRNEKVKFERTGCYLNEDYYYDCSDCVFEVDGQQCQSCSLANCNEGTTDEHQAPLIDCGNIIPGATMNLCEDTSPSGLFTVFDSELTTDCSGEIEFSVIETCGRKVPAVEAAHAQFGYKCLCEPHPFGDLDQAVFQCHSPNCLFCDSEEKFCGVRELSEDMREEGEHTSMIETFQYTLGRSEKIEFGRTHCIGDTCENCIMLIDGQGCSSCTLETCGEGDDAPQVPRVDCENLIPGAILDPCQPDSTSELLLPFSPDEFNVCSRQPSTKTFCSASRDSAPTDGSIILGSTVEVEFDGTQACHSEITSPGLWYVVEGEGDPIKASTCSPKTNFNTKISVFSGSCDALECVGESIDDPECHFDEISAHSITWFGEEGVEYYVRVHGVDEEVGDFGLRIQSGWQIDFGSNIPAPANNMCEGAGGPFIERHTRITGSTKGASAESACGASAPGVWYSIETGDVSSGHKNIAVATCSEESSSAHAVSVLRGEDCGTLTCMEGLHTAECQNGQSISWTAEPEEKYYIFVHVDEDSTEGPLQLEVIQSPVVQHDECPGAISIPIDGRGAIGGTTHKAGADSPTHGGDLSCGLSSGMGGGVWYQVNGNGAHLRASTCFEGTDHPTSVLVFAGACDDLHCIVADNGSQKCDESPFNASTVTWLSEVDTTYYILVQSRNKEEFGNFHLGVSEMHPASNDACPNSIDLLPSNDTVIVGSTYNATRDFAAGSWCGTTLNYQGTWYSYEGKDLGVTVSTCNIATSYEPSLSIFDGACGNLTCVDDVAPSIESCPWGESGATISWYGEKGRSYFVYVHGFAGLNAVGTYGLTVEEFPVAVLNDFCHLATPLLTHGAQAIVAGDVSLASVDTAGSNFCGVPISSPGLWYKITGRGDQTSASLCSDGTTSTMAVSVFKGSCGNVQCVTGKTFLNNCDALAGSRRSLQGVEYENSGDPATWLTEDGETYYILVHSVAHQGNETVAPGASGPFELSITTSSAAEAACHTMISNIQDKKGDSEICECITDPVSGELSLACADSSCTRCNRDKSLCYANEKLGRSFDDRGSVASRWESFQYSFGRSETFLLEQDLLKSECRVSIDNTTCNSCEIVMCDDGTESMAVDCQNVETGAQLAACGSSGPALATQTVLEGKFGHGFDKCVGDDDEELFQGPYNPICSESIQIVPDEPGVWGSTILSDAMKSLNPMPLCEIHSKAPGVWYRVMGTGRNLVASTCSDKTNYSTAMAIFSGDCSTRKLSCLESSTSDLSCSSGGGWAALAQEASGGSMIPWASEEGVTYYIYVFGSTDDEVGTFEVSVTTVDDNIKIGSGGATPSLMMSAATMFVTSFTFLLWQL